MSFWQVVALRVLLVIVIGVPLVFLLLWLGLGENVARSVALVIAVLASTFALKFRRPPSTQK